MTSDIKATIINNIPNGVLKMNKRAIINKMKRNDYHIVDADGWNDVFTSSIQSNDKMMSNHARISSKIWKLGCEDSIKILKAIDDDLRDKIQEFEYLSLENGRLCYNFRRFDGYQTKFIA